MKKPLPFLFQKKGEGMSYLYEHRDQLDELKHFAEIAYRATYGMRPPDRDDLEQDIVIAMMFVL